VKRKAFSLIELLLVIVIIGVVYTLALGSFEQLAKKETGLSLEKMKEYLFSLEYEKTAKLLCLDDCLTCDLVLDGNVSKTIDSFVDDTVKTYRYDFLYGYVEQEPDVYFNVENIQEDVCFSYELDKNGVGSQILVEFNEKFYDFSSYFREVGIYNSIEEAREAKEEVMKEVRR